MSALFRRCGCRDAAGKTYGVLGEKPTSAQLERACPRMLEDAKHGRWSFRISAGIDPMTKKRRQVNGGTYDTKREALQARNLAAVKVDQGKILKPSTETFAEYLPKWLERRSRLRMNNRAPLAPNTIENYRRYIEQDIAPSRLGGLKVKEIRRRHVQALIDELIAAGRGSVTVRRILAVIQGALTTAVVDEILEENPARNIDLPEVEETEFRPWEPEEVGRFLDVAAEHRLGALFELAMFTGLRRGELLGLKWAEHVDLSRRQLFVRNNRTRSGDGGTKTDASRDVVPLSDQAVGALVAWQIAQQAERSAADVAWQESDYVFTMEDGRPLKPQYATRLFEKLRKQAGLSKMTFHGQRHQTAALLIASGEELVSVSKILRHSSTTVTDKFYASLVTSKAHAAVNNAGALVPRATAPAHTPHAQGGEEAEKPAPVETGTGL